MISLLVAVLVTIAVYWLCTAAGLPLIIAGIVALIVFLVGLSRAGGTTWRGWW